MTTYFELNKENRELKAKINLLDNRIDNLNRDIALRDDQMLRLRDNNRDSERRLRNTLNNERTWRREAEIYRDSLGERLNGLERERRLELERYRLSREHLQIEIDDRDEELEEKRIRIRDLRNNYGELEEMGLRLLNAFFQKEVELRKEKVIANSYKTQRDWISQQSWQDRINFLTNIRAKIKEIKEYEEYLVEPMKY